MPGAGTLQGGPAVHAEILANIQSLLVVINEPFSADKYTLTSTSLLRDQAAILPFPTTVLPQDFKPQIVNENAFSLRLRLAQNVTATQDSEKSILNARDLKDISSIQCRECNATLSNKAFPAVKDLPSEHWMELVECWICHETSEKEHSGKLQPIVARPNLLLVSNTYLLFHPEDVENVKLDSRCPPVNWENVIAMKWIPMVCSVCNSAVGEKQYRVSHNENGAIPNAEAIKLYKYAVKITRKEIPADTLQFDASFQRYVAMDFIELFSAHATYKFLIYDRSDESIHGLVNNHPKLIPIHDKCLELKNNCKQIWVFNPDIQVYSSVSNIDGGWQRAMKVLYIDNEQDAAAASRHIEKWKIDKSVDRLTYPGKYCRELFAKLAENNLAIPEHLRKAPAGSPLADFRFAYLTR